MMHVIVAVYVISAVSLLVIYFLVNRQQRKKEKKQTSKPQDLVPKKDTKGGWGVGGRTPIGVSPWLPSCSDLSHSR